MYRIEDEETRTKRERRFRAEKGQLARFQGYLPERQGQNLAVTALCVPYSLDSGKVWRTFTLRQVPYKPSTQNPKPQTSNPKPSTLIPESETRSSKPQTLRSFYEGRGLRDHIVMNQKPENKTSSRATSCRQKTTVFLLPPVHSVDLEGFVPLNFRVLRAADPVGSISGHWKWCAARCSVKI